MKSGWPGIEVEIGTRRGEFVGAGIAGTSGIGVAGRQPNKRRCRHGWWWSFRGGVLMGILMGLVTRCRAPGTGGTTSH